MLIIKRLFSENIEILAKITEAKRKLKQNETLLRNVDMTTSLSRRIYKIMIHEIQRTSINTQNQQEIIVYIKRQNATLHSRLKIAKMI